MPTTWHILTPSVAFDRKNIYTVRVLARKRETDEKLFLKKNIK
jgi:hypothetical protein